MTDQSSSKKSTNYKTKRLKTLTPNTNKVSLPKSSTIVRIVAISITRTVEAITSLKLSKIIPINSPSQVNPETIMFTIGIPTRILTLLCNLPNKKL